MRRTWVGGHSAVQYQRQAVEVADQIGNVQAQAEARRDLAWSLLGAGDLPDAGRAAEEARGYPYPPSLAGIALVGGIIALRRGDVSSAKQAFRDAVGDADQRLEASPQDYESLDTKALALAGLTLTGPTDRTGDAVAVLHAARDITPALGITARILQRLDTYTPADPTGRLLPLRTATTDHNT